MSKDFIDWMCLKTELDDKDPAPIFSERDIWWCSVGINVGKETDGKNEFFNRPVLVLRKFNKWTFYGVPLSSQLKDNRYYLPIHFKDRTSAALISQMRVFDSKRLSDPMGKLSVEEFEKVRQAIKNLL